MTKRNVLASLSIGSQIAEDEADSLSRYFVETHLWRRVFSGEVDIVFGSKGSGKSAIYALLLDRAPELARNGCVVIPGENLRGVPVFNDLQVDPPTTEREFQALWKVYFLTLVGRHLQQGHQQNILVQQLLGSLGRAGLVFEKFSLESAFSGAAGVVKRLFRPEAVEGGVRLDPTTGTPVGLTGKIVFGEPSTIERASGAVSADSLLKLANEALEQLDARVWIALDRLDNAFFESLELERSALRALFRVYVDMRGLDRIGVKIFLRDDIMRRVTREGFRELSHITRQATIQWDGPSLLSLVIRRLVMNSAFCEYYDVSPDLVSADHNEQRELFFKVFPEKVERGKRRPDTFSWMLSHTSDGHGAAAPREIIHLLSVARDQQIRMMELGQDETEAGQLFEGAAIKGALPEVSRVRLNQTFLAEYPRYRRYVEALEGEKTEQTVVSLSRLWNLTPEVATQTASELAELGFFESRGKGTPTFWVPFLYRHALRMSQGAAE